MINISVPNIKPIPDMTNLISEYGDSLLRMCFIYLKDIHLAEDAVQDTFIKVYKSYSKFKGHSEEKTWIMRIAINVCKNYLRSSWWKRINETVNLDNIPASTIDGSTQDDALLLEIMKLSPKYKEVILLFYYQDMKIREISEVLQTPESTISVRLKRAREKLKIKLKGWCYDE
ncbi:sigma-70 family RNA polymerase sigma factor [Clostridium tagluense]|uniref:sigma-70 family RNA polymerase sigma factor n=1 Tax=Clostridium tagluense TaxID=360422 RepID=UPI001C0E29B1|nr:sigma-70 family RNA polymerase sigma factor [Clostridium tagluense]MBU3129106.1 sigma-70 family RNA polymerase sigma factor [Clostridium tagluense]MCB2311327.1 sigma-70 family RNA polymerase sigma factor [Clostridium tagluense]MCB2316031.1 sigma-70 family RNA polymerase sigma factor [Clostridium tagluense]MCB2320903.1 sigma-70 family RNA polymerase sigma factor [Clostridium tagluense]MCB2325900.1 sigma-70 family RNA polymerase sigma factor [Clostridium tagluense]